MPLNALIFDFDGLIMDTENAIYEAWRELYEQHGHGLTLQHWAQCVGSDFNSVFDPKAELESLTGISFDWIQLEADLTARVHQMLDGYDTLPGVRDLLQAAQTLGLPCAVASSSPLSWVGSHLEKLGLRSYFASVSTREDVQRIKPAPDLFLHAAERLNCQPCDALILEDSLNGLNAALAANIRCIAVPGRTTEHLDFSPAWRRLGSLTELDLPTLRLAFT
jgi:putative hydrolase of the HAD superfamily